MKQLKGDAWEFINRSKHGRCISSIPQLNRNSIEFSLSTQTRRVIKSPQAKSLHAILGTYPDIAYAVGCLSKYSANLDKIYLD